MSKQKNDNYSNPVLATFNGIVDLFRHKEPFGELGDNERLDRKTCLVTGANSGLGRAIALDMARRGGHVIMACRSGIPQAGEALKTESGSDNIDMVKLDLADFYSIHACCDELKKRGVTLDRVVLNAGLVLQKADKTAQGFETMFGVHALGNHVFLQRLLADGSIPNRSMAGNAKADGSIPRIVVISSETHRSGSPIELDNYGEFVDYNAMGSIAQYGHSKLALTVLVMELGRRLQDEQGVDVAVHACCPGPVNSNIARQAPKLFKPLLSVIMGALFASPEKAAKPALFLSIAEQVEGQSGLYLHLMVKKDPAPQVLDKSLAGEVWQRSETLIQSHS